MIVCYACWWRNTSNITLVKVLYLHTVLLHFPTWYEYHDFRNGSTEPFLLFARGLFYATVPTTFLIFSVCVHTPDTITSSFKYKSFNICVGVVMKHWLSRHCETTVKEKCVSDRSSWKQAFKTVAKHECRNGVSCLFQLNMWWVRHYVDVAAFT